MIGFVVLLPFLLIFLFVTIFKDLLKSSLAIYLLTLIFSIFYGVYFQEIINAHIDAFLTSLKIFFLVFSLLFLFKVIEEENKNFFSSFKQKNFTIFITIGIFLTILIEGLVGFGTPGMICVKTLYDLGFNSLLSARVTLISDLYSTFGAFSTPVVIGNKNVESFNFVKYIGLIFSLVTFLIFCSSCFLYKRIYRKEKINIIRILPAFIIFSISTFIISQTDFFTLTIIISSFFSLVFLFLENFSLFRSFLSVFSPFFISIIFFVFLKSMKIELIDVILSNFNVAPIVFLFAVFILLIKKKISLINIKIKETIRKSFKLFFVTFFFSFLSNYLIFSGKNQYNLPSALEIIKNNLIIFNNFYFFISPLIGVFGAFIFGSATLSNLTFSNIQKEISLELNLNTEKILALQNIGAGLGNTVSLFNIIAITTMIDELKNKEIEILKTNFILTLIFSIFSSFIVYFVNL